MLNLQSPGFNVIHHNEDPGDFLESRHDGEEGDTNDARDREGDLGGRLVQRGIQDVVRSKVFREPRDED